MEILLVNPSLRPDSEVKIIPVGLACIATALRDVGYTPDILDVDLHRYDDESIKQIVSKKKYGLIGFGNIISSYSITKKLAVLLKSAAPQAKIVLGNTVASIPEQILEWNDTIDLCVIGEGDVTIVELVKALKDGQPLHSVDGIAFRENNKIVVNAERKVIKDINTLPFPDYSLFDVDEYLKTSYLNVGEPYPIPRETIRALPINTARGCVANCTFCYHAFKGTKYRYYSFSNVLNFYKELQHDYKVNYLNFWDELTIMSPQRLVELCDEIEKAKLNVYWSISPRGNTFNASHLDLLKRAKDLGALTIGGALESASPEILQAINKKITAEQFIEQMETASKAGLIPRTSIIFGYPQETKETISLTMETCKKAGVYPSAGFLLPLPKTIVYENAKIAGLIQNEEEYLLSIGDRQDLHLNLTKFSDDELLEVTNNALVDLQLYFGMKLKDPFKTQSYKMACKNAS